MARATVLLVGCAACRGDVAADEACLTDPPAAGEIRVAEIVCSDQLIPGGEGQVGDLLMANAQVRAVLRHVESSVTLAGHDGGTLADLAPWGLNDRLHEVIPLVAGGWIDVDSWVVDADGLTLSGTPRRIPGGDLPDAGTATIRWSLAPDGWGPTVTGATALRVHPSGSWSLRDGRLTHADQGLDLGAGQPTDLGGAVDYTGATRIWVAPLATAVSWGDGATLSGTAVDATDIVVQRDGVTVLRVPVVDDRFEATLPEGSDRVRAEAPGRAPSAWIAPGETLALDLGGTGVVDLIVAFEDGVPRPSAATWTASDGRSGVWSLPPGGATLSLGAGVHDLHVTAGPGDGAIDVHLELDGSTPVVRAIALPSRWSRPHHVLVDLGRAVDRDRFRRGTSLGAVEGAASAGFDHVIAIAEDDVPSVNALLVGWPRVTVENGVRSEVVDGLPGAVTAWPWSADPDRPAHGAVVADGLTAPELALAMGGGPGGHRHVLVDLGLLGDGTPPSTWPRAPDLVELVDPETDPTTAWADWFRWLDAGLALGPAGPLLWAEVDDPALFGPVDVAQALADGRVSAGTGPLLTLTVDGKPPGTRLHNDPFRASQHRVDWSLGAVDDLDRVVLLGPEGAILASWDTPSTSGSLLLPLEGYVLAAAFGANGAWAVTGAVFVDGPATP